MKHLFIAFISFTLVACIQTGRYSQRHDSAPNPKFYPDSISMRDAIPIYEPYWQRGNQSYVVFGKRYFPMQTGLGYEASGEASWYGQKFHGHLTANGETYDMYQMTAAHKTLPIPSYVQVTNMANGKTAIVRVNDRGPFHDKRLIDLSYAAAKKLDMLKTGTANVKLEVIHVDEGGTMHIGKRLQKPESPLNTGEKAIFIQVAALQNQKKIDEMAKGLTVLYQVPTHVPKKESVYRLRLGPFKSDEEASALLGELKKSGYDNAYKLYAPH